MQQAMNPVEAAATAAGATTNIFDAINRAKLSGVQRALAQQELQHQIAMDPLQQQAEALQNQSEAAKLPYVGQTAQANIAGLYALGGLRSATANNKNAVTPSVIDKNEAAAGLSGQRGDLIGQTINQNSQIDPIKVQDALTKSNALPGQIQSNLDLAKTRMNDLGVHAHNQEIMGPFLAAHMDAATNQLHAQAAKDEAATDVMAKALAAGTDTKDSAAPQNVAQHWDWNQPDAIPNFLNYTQLYTQQKLDPSGQKSLYDKDGTFTTGVQAAGKTLGMGIVNQQMKQQAIQQQNEVQSQQIRQGLMQLLSGGQRQPQQAAPAPVAPPQAAPPPPSPSPSPQPIAPPPQSAAPPGPQYQEGAILTSPSTGRMFKIVNGQPVELPPNAPPAPSN